jgi:hypothetical protein
MQQEFAELVRQLFDVQVYPDLREYPDGPPEQPYDAAGWTLPYQMDVHVIAALSPLSAEFVAATRPLRADSAALADDPAAPFDSSPLAAAIVPPAGSITGSGDRLAVRPQENNAFRMINRTLASGGTVRFQSAGADGSGGRYLIDGIPQNTLRDWVTELHVRAERTNASGDAAVRSRIAVYKPWRASMDEGWTRWLLDDYGFDYTSITNADVQAGSLRDRFDVILLASDAPRTILDGYAPGSVPPRYAGGIGAAGVRALDAFVRDGGTLVCLNQSADFAIEQLGLPVKNAVDGVERRAYFASGSILEVITDPAHPVMAGMPERAKVFVDDSPVFTTLDGFEGVALAKYAAQGSPLLSGYLLGEDRLHGLAAALDVRHGDGHVLLIGFRPQWRGQPVGTFRVVFNALLFGSEMAADAGGTPGFWTPPPPTPPDSTEGSASSGAGPFSSK